MASREGWTLVDKLGTDSCDASAVDRHRSDLPPVVHYCQVRFLAARVCVWVCVHACVCVCA